MACGVALKRSLDFDPLHSTSPSATCHDGISTPSAKRRRCTIVPRCGSGAPVTTSVLTSSVSTSVWRKYSSLTPESGSSTAATISQSPFTSASKKCSLSSEQIVKHVYQEYRRMKKRRQLKTTNYLPVPLPVPHDNNAAFASAAHMASDVSSTSSSLPSITLDSKSPSTVVFQGKQNADTSILSMKQVSIICERLLKEQEVRLQTEYEKALVDKLSEQYDAFVKFSHDQLFQQLQSRPASCELKAN